MKKTKASLAMMGITAAAVVGMLLMGMPAEDRPASVKTCQVRMGQVEQVLAVSGVVRYEMEYAAISPQSGVVAQVYVQPGERVQAGQALFRLQEEIQAAAVSTALQSQGAYASMLMVHFPSTQVQQAKAQMESLIVRAAADGLVQQVNITENGGILAGNPAVALSGEKQCIQCSVVLRDAQELRPGMQARILKDGEIITQAVVQRIDPAQVSAATGQTVCMVSLTPAEAIRLPLGAAVEAEIVRYGQQNVPVLPMEALTARETVWWVADGRSYEIPAEVVMADEVSCWVNLPEGTEVICGGDRPAQGQRVKEMKP